MTKIPERLKELRQGKGLKQTELADLLGIKEVSYQRFEYGSSGIKLDKLIQLADFYNVSLDYLVGRTDKK